MSNTVNHAHAGAAAERRGASIGRRGQGASPPSRQGTPLKLSALFCYGRSKAEACGIESTSISTKVAPIPFPPTKREEEHMLSEEGLPAATRVLDLHVSKEDFKFSSAHFSCHGVRLLLRPLPPCYPCAPL